MAQITIVGLGPGAAEQLTREAWELLCGAGELWVRTVHHPVVAELPAGLTVHSFDSLYENHGTFPEVYTAIVARVLDLGRRDEGVLYAVPGHPFVGEATVAQICEQAEAQGIPVRVSAGLSFIEPALSALGVDALDGLQIVDALAVLAVHHPPLNPDLPALVAQVYDRQIASGLKLTLMNQYPDEHQVALVEAAGTVAQRVQWLPLYAIDRRNLGPLTSLYVPALPPVSSFEGFQATIAQLRAPDGCPWDRKQTHESLRTTLLEETYEVLSALDAQDVVALREELGDLLLQIVLHAQIATEAGEFQMAGVIAAIDAKLRRRHPHVWGEVTVEDVEQVTVNWEALKREEREANGQAEHSLLEGVPQMLPALAQAYIYVDRARRVGFDWPDIDAVLNKVREELAEVEAAQGEARVAEVGDLLLATVNWARWLGVEAESALREANARFAGRFRYVERWARQHGVALETVSAEQLLQIWEEAKIATQS